MKRIVASDVKEMTEICAELARQGITFEAMKYDTNTWHINIVGW